jgi:hypothetical protein
MTAVATARDLWPDDLTPLTPEPTPAAILRQQGQLLGQKTGNAVYGEVRSEQDGNGPSEVRPNKFTHSFQLTSGYLRFSRPILYVKHDLQSYPADVIVVTPDGSGKPIRNVTVRTAKELEATLREAFSLDEVKEIIRSLVAQSQDVDE